MPKRSLADLSINSSKRRRNASGPSQPNNKDNIEIDTLLRSTGFRRLNSMMSASVGCSYELLREMSNVQDKIQSLFKEDRDNTWRVLSSNLKQMEFLKSALTPLACADGVSQPAGGSRSYTLLRCFLECAEAQDILSDFLMQTVVDVSGSPNTDTGLSSRIEIAGRILSQFRWIAFPGKRAASIVSQLLELLDAVLCNQLQHDIISLLPELATTEELVQKVSEQLNQLLVTDPRHELTPVVFDALTGMPLDPVQRTEIRDTAVALLDSSPVVSLPTLVKYLLQSTPCTTSAEREALCKELRRGIDWDSFDLTPVTTSTQRKTDSETSGKPFNDLEEDKTMPEHASAAVLTAEVIRLHCTFQRGLADSWVRVLSETLEDVEERANSDLIMLLILHPLAKAKSVESVIKNRLQKQKFSPSMLRRIFKGFKAILKAHFPAVLQVAQSLLPPKEHLKSDNVSSFAAGLYSYSFSCLPSYYQQEVVGALITHVGSLRGREADVALTTLSDLVKTDPMRMQPFIVFIKSLFDRVESLSGSQVRRLYTILSSLAFRCGEQTALRDELHILIRKQLSHVTPFYRSLGVIGAVTMIQYLVNSTSCENGGEVSASPISNTSTSSSSSANSCPPPAGASREVVHLLRLVRTSYARLPALGCLFMDELYGLLVSNTLESSVETWIADTVMRDFQNDFVIDNELPKVKALWKLWSKELNASDWCLKYSLDKNTECEIAVNFGPLWLRSLGIIDPSTATNSKNLLKRVVSPLCLAPHFRLLCLCERRCQEGGNLESIDALLGCPVLLPKDYSNQPALLALLINWLIEVLNGFCEQDTQEMRAKLLWRLQHVVSLRRMLLNALTENQSPDTRRIDMERCQRHSLPRVIFENGSDWAVSSGMVRVVKSMTQSGDRQKKSKNEKKKHFDVTEILKENEDDEKDEEECGENTKSHISGEKKAVIQVDRNALRFCFREISVHCSRLLDFSPVCILDLNSISSSVGNKEEEKVALSHVEAAFLLTDFRSKLSYRLNVSSQPVGFGSSSMDESLFHRHLDAGISDLELTRLFIRLLPSLRRRMQKCISYLRGEEGKGNPDEEGSDSDSCLVNLESEEGKAVTMSLCHILDSIRIVLLWLDRPTGKGSGNPLEKPLLSRFLRCLSGQESGEDDDDDRGKTASECLRYFTSWIDALPHIHAAALHCELMVKLGKFAGAGSDAMIQEYTLELLNRDWDANVDWEGKRFRDSLQALVHAHFECVSTARRSDFLLQMASNHLKSVVESSQRCAAYVTLSRSSFSIYFRESLLQVLKVAKCASTGAAPSGEKLSRWGKAVDIFSALMNHVRQQSEPQNVSALLRNGRQFVQSMLRDAMPLMDNVFRARQEEVSSLLKRIQQITRFLQHLCGYSKGSKDAVLASYVPQLKRVLEAFIYRVKVMLSSNRCGEAFWLGNLKNRNLQGEEIHSEDEEEDEEEEDSNVEEEDDNEVVDNEKDDISDISSDAGSVSASY